MKELFNITPGLSKRILVLILIIWSYAFAKYERWKDYHLIQWDPLEYYAFLPQLFIEHDLSYAFLEKKQGTHWDNLFLKTLPDGTAINKRTIGLAICELPCFLAAHCIAGITGYIQDGFSLPYQLALAIDGILYAFIGFIFLRKILLRFFSEAITSAALLILFLGTNIWAGTLLEIGLTHPYSFMFFSLFLYLVILWLEKPAYKYAISLGLIAGIITLLRPTDVIILIVPLLFGITSSKDLISRINFFREYKLHLAVFTFFLFFTFIPQMIYWKYMSGHWILYSYSNEIFYFSKPHILSGLFSYRKGWLLYTPVMVFALIGIFMLRKYAKEFFWPTLIFTLLNIWIVLSWWCWYYGGSFGLRAKAIYAAVG